MFSTDETFDNLLIIGNGFDLNLGLKTAYSDFLESNQFKLGFDNKNLISQHVFNKYKIANWVNIENELKNINQSFQPKTLDQHLLNLKVH